MRLLAVLFFALLSVPALAADYTPRSNPSDEVIKRWYCCQHCRADEAPCNGQCVKLQKGEDPKKKCGGQPGCACAYGEGNI